jgi:hypothetical protein
MITVEKVRFNKRVGGGEGYSVEGPYIAPFTYLTEATLKKWIAHWQKNGIKWVMKS